MRPGPLSMEATPEPMFVLLAAPLPEKPPFALELGVGALVTFEGIVRDNNDGKAVVELEYAAYPELAKREGSRIVGESIERFGLFAGCCFHRIGVVHPGDVAVRVWAAAAHRQEAFQACELIIDAVKASVPIWKREVYASGDSAWITCAAPVAHQDHRHRATP